MSKLLVGLFFAILLNSAIAGAADYAQIRQQLNQFLGRNPYTLDPRVHYRDGLSSGHVSTEPWSGSDWRDLLGSIARRYRKDDQYASLEVPWEVTYLKLTARLQSLRKSFKNLSQSELNDLSPAEKYDLLLGDPEFSFTREVIAWVDEKYRTGRIAKWSGICHGWAPSSLKEARPVQSAEFPILGDRTLVFFPEDIKGLVTMLWAHSFAQDQVQLEGSQCNGVESNELDTLGRPQSDSCRRVHPAFFHLALIEYLGVSKTGLVLDTQLDSVMNRPVIAYQLRYFNPKTWEMVPTPDQARVELKQWSADPLVKWRSKNAAAVMGVEAELMLRSEVNSTARSYDGPIYDQNVKKVLRYDLELDADGRIIGGEWRFQKDKALDPMDEEYWSFHPDLVWKFPSDLRAYSRADWDIRDISWSGKGPVPSAWQAAAKEAAATQYQYFNERLKKVITAKHPQPIASVVYMILERSHHLD